MLAPAPIARTKASDTEDGRSPTPAMPAQMIGVFTRPVKATGRAFYRPYGMPFLVSGFVLWYLTWPVFSSIWAAHALKFLRTQRLPAALTGWSFPATIAQATVRSIARRFAPRVRRLLPGQLRRLAERAP